MIESLELRQCLRKHQDKALEKPTKIVAVSRGEQDR
jgi:hypothetical protein